MSGLKFPALLTSTHQSFMKRGEKRYCSSVRQISHLGRSVFLVGVISITMIKIAVIGGLIALGIAVYFGQFRKTLTKKPSDLNPQYDYVIVGGGTAGAVLAARLSEQPSISVLLLEAGSEETDLFYSHIPGAVPFLQGTNFDWQYYTVPQTHCCNGLLDNQGKWPRGKCLGGSSVLNYLHYVRGHPSDYDNYWVPATGDDSWSYKSLMHYFKKAESIQIDHLRTSEHHGTDGPLPVGKSVETPLGFAYLEALRQKGFTVTDDSSGAVFEGFSRVQATVSNGKRFSSATAYLRPAMTRSNLHVVTKAHVTKVVFNYNDEEKRAVGVEYMHEGNRHRVLANREIILSSGVIGSPQLLLVSGIGDRNQLESLNIDVVHELPAVGKNMKDHLIVHTLLSLNESIGINAHEVVSPLGLIKASFQWLLFGTGPLSNTGLELTGFMDTGLTKEGRPDVQLYMFPTNPMYDTLYKLVNMKPEVNEALQEPTFGKPVAFIASVLMHPQNDGEIRLQSKDPFVPPIIDPRYLQNDVDVEVLVRGLELMIDTALTTKPLQQYGAALSEKPMPGCQDHELYSHDYWRCVARNRVFTLYHPVSTCRMGKSPTDSVVDNELRVHGIKGLRIVDASIFPDQISGNPYGPIVMVAEKAADLIKATPFTP